MVLRHDLPDGSSHFDWLIEPDASRLLISFRTGDWVPDAASMLAVRTPDHRRLYLDYEGPVSHDRGRVVRLAAGFCIVRVERPRSLIVDAAFAVDSWVRWQGEPLESAADTWRFFSRRIEPSDDRISM